jgi:hypothetical protein
MRMRITIFVTQLVLVGLIASVTSVLDGEQRRGKMSSSSLEADCTPAAFEDGLKLDSGDVVSIICISNWYVYHVD